MQFRRWCSVLKGAGAVVGGEACNDRDSAVGKELEDYYATYMARVPLLLHRRSEKRLSLEACQDIAQETFLNVARRIQSGELDEGVNIAAYLTTAAKNLTFSRMRARRNLELADELPQTVSELAEEERALFIGPGRRAGGRTVVESTATRRSRTRSASA
ncbi:RNA polymerase sigma factor [Streptomyces kronopolitis]|uniref:RNA polymerase sigma factor n=1 Tax=Streptomyces kronopolitis TaxID=1612435 RepID=UPI00342FCC05